MIKHTKGPLITRYDDSMGRRRIGSVDSTMFDIAYCSGATRAEAEANAARLVDCWNACEGLADPTVVPEMLLALKRISAWLSHLHTRDLGQTEGFEIVSEVILRAEGRK